MMLHVDRRSALTALVVSCLSLLLPLPAAAFSPDQPAPPSVEFGELYHAVEMAGLFPDQKTFADAIPNKPPAQVMAGRLASPCLIDRAAPTAAPIKECGGN